MMLNETVGTERRGYAGHTILVVVPSMAAVVTAMDALSLVDSDYRIRIVFTAGPVTGAMSRDVEEFLRVRGCPVLPWRQALRKEFDLVLASGPLGLAQLSGKAFLLPALAREESGDPVDDICYDRLLASIPFRAGYRRAFGLSRGQKLVLVTATSIDESTVDFLARLLAELPAARYRVGAVVPADVWSTYGAWQVRGWLADCLGAGLLLLAPGEGWRGALVAADIVVGGGGWMIRYGAAIGLPVLMVDSGSGGTDLLCQHARSWRPDEPVGEQIEAAMIADRAWQDKVAECVTRAPGYAGENLRKEMYRMLGLAEPERPVPCLPVPLPHLIHDDTTWWSA